MHWNINNETSLQTVAGEVLEALNGDKILLLRGEMGAGKTTVVRYLAQTMGLDDAVHSPTYTLCNTYGDGRLLHLDLYRLGGERDVASMDIEHILEKDADLIVIEWPERLGRYTPKSARTLRINVGQGEQRELQLS